MTKNRKAVILRKPFALCHSEEAKRPKNLAQDKLRDEESTLILRSFPFPFVRLRVRVRMTEKSQGSPSLSVILREHFVFCHSEGARRPKNLDPSLRSG